MSMEVMPNSADWRSEDEKKKGLLRKAMSSTFKTWIPDHPEGSVERGECFGLYKEAVYGGEEIVLQSLLSSGVEDIHAHRYTGYPLSMQELLVEREGTDAFLDPRNALRVVRRKFGMMTLISRMASTFEQRDLIAITLKPGFTQAEYLEFGRMLSGRVEGTAAEEARKLRKALKRSSVKHVKLLFHSDLVGRHVPVPWEVKHFYSELAMVLQRSKSALKKATQDFCDQALYRLNVKAIRELILFNDDLLDELDLPDDFDPLPTLLERVDEQILLNAVRNIFDEFKAMQSERAHARAVSVELRLDDINVDFEQEAKDAVDPEDAEEMRRLAHALERVRRLLGRSFFSRISMVSGAINFMEAATGRGDSAALAAQVPPEEAFNRAIAIEDPLQRAQALEGAVLALVGAGLEAEARLAAEQALAAARDCNDEVTMAYTFALSALLRVRHTTVILEAMEDAFDVAHRSKNNEQRDAAITRLLSVLLETGALSTEIREVLPELLIGDDIHFWRHPDLKPSLVELCLTLVTGEDDQTLIFLQTLMVHPNPQIRQSVARAMPMHNREEFENLLLSHLKDSDPDVRTEVADRIGWKGERKLVLYLVNHLRHAGPEASDSEKRAFALNLARLESRRFLPLFNAMLGRMATKDPKLTKVQAVLRDDEGLQMAALEILYRLNYREARRLLFKADEQAPVSLKHVTEALWREVKSKPYGEPVLPRSPHDPEFSEEDDKGFLALVQELEEAQRKADEAAAAGRPERPASVEAPQPEAPTRGSFFGRLKRKFLKHEESEAEGAPEGIKREKSAAELSAELSLANIVDADVMLEFEANLLEGPELWSGRMPMAFRIYLEAQEGEAIWTERHANVEVDEGQFMVNLGLKRKLPDSLPERVYLGVAVNKGKEMSPRFELLRVVEEAPEEEGAEA